MIARARRFWSELHPVSKRAWCVAAAILVVGCASIWFIGDERLSRFTISDRALLWLILLLLVLRR